MLIRCSNKEQQGYDGCNGSTACKREDNKAGLAPPTAVPVASSAAGAASAASAAAAAAADYWAGAACSVVRWSFSSNAVAKPIMQPGYVQK